jgi:hypothetical protein
VWKKVKRHVPIHQAALKPDTSDWEIGETFSLSSLVSTAVDRPSKVAKLTFAVAERREK